MKNRIPNAWRRAAGRLALAGTGVLGLAMAAQTGIMSRATLFVHYLEASRHADGIAGKITTWERVVYSFILSNG